MEIECLGKLFTGRSYFDFRKFAFDFGEFVRRGAGPPKDYPRQAHKTPTILLLWLRMRTSIKSMKSMKQTKKSITALARSRLG
jgi:hypothetical protein